ncbi:MAG: NADPH-dependent FMN reductase [Parachlamydiaceae bacterium]
MKILAIGGSVRENSYSSLAAKTIVDQLGQKGVDAVAIHLKDFLLPFANGLRNPLYPDIWRLQKLISSANALVLCTPEYHGGMGGALKNALDLLSEKDFRGKPIVLVSVMGGVSSNNAINQLRIIMRHLKGLVLPEQLLIANATNAFDVGGRLVDPQLRERLNEMLERLIDVTNKLSINE